MTPRRSLQPILIVSALLVALLGLNACHPTAVPSITQALPSASATLLSGRVEFTHRTVAILPSTVTSLATVTLYNRSNQAVAVGKTDGAGNFALEPGTNLIPVVGDVFVLDAYKAVASNGVGADVARLRTVVSWTGTGWNSCTGTPIVINTLTTAVAVIQGLQASSIQPRDALNTVSGGTVSSPLSAISDNWSAVNTMVSDLLAKDQDPIARITFGSSRYYALPDTAATLWLGPFQGGTFTETALDSSGYLQLAGPKPTPNNGNSELAYFQCAGMNQDGAGVVATDGTYLYVHAWSTYASTTANALVFKKIGTGFNGTTRGTNYGTIGPVTSGSSTAVCWNGGIYFPNGNANQLGRVDTTTGTLTNVNTGAVTLNRSPGTPGVPDLIACDGTYFYNLSYSINARAWNVYNGFTVQVLNPANGFSLVRQFTMDPGDSYYCDGVFCDGTYLYPIEWTGNGTARMRRYRLLDGVREAEWTFSQVYGGGATGGTYVATANDPISGSWDPVNKVFWIGNLKNDWVHLLKGGSFLANPSGMYLSAPLDSQSGTPRYGRLNWTATAPASTSLSLQVRSANTLADLATATWYGPTATSDAYISSGALLNPVHAKQRYLQIQATMSTTDTAQTAKLQSLGVEVLP